MNRIIFVFSIFMSLSAAAQNVGIGNAAPASKLDVSGDLALREGTAITVAAGSNTITLPTAKNSVYRLTGATAAFAITSISAANNGMVLTLINATGQVMTVNNGSNIQTNTGAGLVATGTVASVTLTYNSTLGLWVVTSGQGFPATGMTNIYNTDGTLTGNRTLTMGADNLTLSSTTGNLIFTPSSTGNVVVGSGDATATPIGGTLRGPNAGSGNTPGGTLTLNAGFAYGSGAGGSVYVNGGTSGSGTNGNVYLHGGYSSGAEGAVYINEDHSGNTFLDAAGGIVTIGRTTAGTAQLTINNGISIDAAATNTGTISSLNTATTGNALTFGGSGAGEGIGSNRANATAGQNQYGVDLYTNFARRLSVTNAGSVGIGTIAPATTLEVSAAATELLKLTSTSGGAGNHAYIDFETYAGAYVDARIGAIDMGTNNGSLVFETGNAGTASTVTTERMRILNTGYVGINNTVPSNTLNVGATTGLGSGIDIGLPNDAYGSNGSSYAIRFYGYRDVTNYVLTAKIAAQRTYVCCAGSGSTPWLEQGADLVFSTTNAPGTAGSAGSPADNTTERMRIKDAGFIGIGTSAPGYPLDVGITTTGSLSGSYGYLAQSGSGTGSSGTGSQPISIHSAGRIFALEYDAQSDRRIKTGLSHPDDAAMLDQLNKLQVTDYSYIDKLQRGDRPKRGFIAQEVEAVLPTAVSRNADVIPSVYAAAEHVSAAHATLTVTTAAAHGFAEGDEILLYDKANKAYHVKVGLVIDPKTFEVYGWTGSTDGIFVYGKKINDFRAVDFDQITALSVGAIQQLSKKVSALEQENNDLKSSNKKLQTQNNSIQSDVDKLKASVETLQQITGAKAEK